MDRDKIMEGIRQDLQYMMMNNMPEYKFGMDMQQTTEVLCPLFGYRNEGSEKADIKVGLDHLAENIGIHIYPNESHYKYLRLKDLNEKQLTGIQDVMHHCVVNHYMDTQRTASNPKLKDILQELEGWAKKCVKVAGKEYTAYMDFGKRAYDSEKYHAIVIEKSGTQTGTIPLRQDRYGKLTHNVQIPLCGEWDRDMEFRMDNCHTLIRKGIESIVGKHLHVSSMAERAALEKEVVEQKTKELGQLMDLKVQTHKYNSWLPMSELNCDRFEHWILDFDFGFNNDNEPVLELKAERGKGAQCETIELGETKLDLDNPEKRIILTGLDDNYPELTAALFQSGKARQVGEYTERHQDYPGADEIEEFHFKRMDVTDLFRKYIQLRNAQYLFSPVTDIRVERKGGEYDLTPWDWMCVKLGGISDLAGKINRTESLILKQYRDKPLYNFLLQDLTHQKFKPEINHLKDAMKRITDVDIRFGGLGAHIPGPHIRCRIDGEQQMSLSIGRELLDKCNEAPDPELAQQQLAALFYSGELRESREQTKSMKI